MGLFSAANIKALQTDDGADLTAADQTEPVSLPCDVTIAPELENSLDLLWARLRSRNLAKGPASQILCFTHWEPREGATTLALALAYRAAQVDPSFTFCLADFDLFQSGLSFLTRLEAESGISNFLMGQAGLDECIRPTALPNLSLLPAGYPTIGRHVAQLFDRCQQLCTLLTERFRYVLLDMPSLRVNPNFAVWAGGRAQSVLVVRAGQARRPAIAKAIATLQLMRLDVAGVVLNAREYHVPKWLYTRT